MKIGKKIWIPLLSVAVLLLLILFVPIPRGSLDDGGTRDYIALTYRVVVWNRLTDDGVYEKTVFYTGDDRNKAIDELWARENSAREKSFIGKIVELNSGTVTVEPEEREEERFCSSRIAFSVEGLDRLNVSEGSRVLVTYTGDIMETYPAQINAVGWKNADDLRNVGYDGKWIEKNENTEYGMFPESDVRIMAIYADCFFARPVIPMPFEIKINGALSEEWCVGDQVYCTYENCYFDAEAYRFEVDLVSVKESTLELDPYVAYKPVIYLYPLKDTEVSVKLTLDGGLTCTYPRYDGGWRVTAAPDGTLTDENGQSYNYLYWEGETMAEYDLSRGFCVRGEDTAVFLEEALARLGLNRREANEFIVYWLPLMEQNPYNVISFRGEDYTDAARLDVSPAPDTLIRVFMAWRAADRFVELPPQELTAPRRTGFTVVEWGGTEIK